MSKIKAGQHPSGIDIQKTITPTETNQPKQIKQPSSSPLPPPGIIRIPSGSQPRTPAPYLPGAAPAPSPSSPSIRPPSINVPGSSKSPLSGETGLKSTLPGIPVQPAPIPTKGKSGRRLWLTVLLILVVISTLGGGAFWWFGIPSDVAISPTPTETPNQTQAPTKTLQDIFNVSSIEIPLVISSSPIADFLSTMHKAVVVSGELKKVTAAGEAGHISLVDLLERFLIQYPAGLKSTLGDDRLMMFYGQKENFGPDGNIATSQSVQNRLVFIMEIKDSTALKNALDAWENSLDRDLGGLFELDITKAKEQGYLTNIYKGFTIRYKNFPHPDMSLDYGIGTGSNSVIYLIFANSREAIYSTIDEIAK